VTGSGAGTSPKISPRGERPLYAYLRGRAAIMGDIPTVEELSSQLLEREIELNEKQVTGEERSGDYTVIVHVLSYYTNADTPSTPPSLYSTLLPPPPTFLSPLSLPHSNPPLYILLPLSLQELFTNGFVRLEKEHESLRDELNLAAAEIAERDRRLNLLAASMNRTLPPISAQSDLSALEMQMQVLNNSIFDKNREISQLQESVGSRKHGRKESRAKIYELEKEVVELLTLVQQGRDELAVKKGELLDIARLVDDYKRKEIRTSERHAGFLDQIDSRDKVIYEQEDTLVVSAQFRSLSLLSISFPFYASIFLFISLSLSLISIPSLHLLPLLHHSTLFLIPLL
jgi:hypothetical protein